MTDTIPPEPVPTDTILVPIPPGAVQPDTLPADTLMGAARDTIRAWSFPSYPEALPTGWAFARWEWGRAELSRYSGLTILEFLERAPGLTVIRSGDHGYPVGITALGLGGGRVRVFLDGFEWDPLGFTSPDLQQMGTINLETVRIARDPTGIRVDLTTTGLPEDGVFSVVEAATGVYGSRLVRGGIVRGFGQRVVFSGAYDAVTTDGWAFISPFSLVSTRAAVSYALSENTGLQLELRNTGIQRLGQELRENADHRTLILRGRSYLAPNLVVDAGVGRSSRNPADGDPLTAGLSVMQAFARANLFSSTGTLEATVRLRNQSLGVSGRPGIEAAVRAAMRLLPGVTTEGEARLGGGGVANAAGRGTLRLGPLQGPSLFASLTAGRLDVPLVSDVARDEPGDDGEEVVTFPSYSAIGSSAGSLRLGASWTAPGVSVSVAGVALPATTLAPFGTAFDRQLGPLAAGSAQGLEAQLTLPVPATRGALRLDGWGEYWLNQGERPYLAARQARVAAVLNPTFYGGQLEPLARFQVIHRAWGNVPNPDPDLPTLRTGQYVLANLLIQIRILDLRAFGLWENAFDYRAATDLPGNELPGLRLIYGFQWVFRN